MAGNDLGKLWFEMGVRDKVTGAMAEAIKEAQRLGKAIDDVADKNANNLTRALLQDKRNGATDDRRDKAGQRNGSRYVEAKGRTAADAGGKATVTEPKQGRVVGNEHEAAEQTAWR